VAWARGERPRVAAHRGASAQFPENTLAAFNAALESGADAIEFDVHATADGELVVVHDYELSRTTSGDGFVHDRRSDYVRSLDAGNWFAPTFAGERVPFVREVLLLSAPAFELEVKGLPSAAFVESVARAVETSGRSDSVEITGHHRLMVSEIKRRLPEVTAGLFVPKKEAWMPSSLYHQLVEHIATYEGFDTVHASLPELRALDVGRLHALGLLVHAADVNGADELLEARQLDVDHLSTNDPAAALELFGRRPPAQGPSDECAGSGR
jgi:glycerophosphoryl diester phosphodiesterase